MLTRLEVINKQAQTLQLPFDEVLNGLSVERIEGLEPVKATLVSSSFASIDGAQYHSSRREPRNIILGLGLEPDYITDSVRDLRHRLYGFLMPKTEVTLRFHEADLTYVDIKGRIESFESPLFVKEPAVDISFMCYDPDFYRPTEDLFEYGTVDTTETTTINYEGTVETGFEFTLLVNRDVSAFTIYNRPPDGQLRTMDFSSPLIAGDVLTISTKQGVKRVTRKRANSEQSFLHALSPQSDWIELHPGPNDLRVYATGVQIPYNIRYTTKYGGL